MKNKLHILLFISLFMQVFKGSSQNSDLTISISDQMINKVFAAVGSIADEDDYQVLMIKGKYSWLVENARIKLENNKALFVADVQVKAGPIKYADRVSGLLDVTYNPKTNKLELRLTHAYLKIKTKIFGKEKIITTVDLANYYKSPFVFDGPIAYQEVFEIEMPDKTVKKLRTVVRQCDIKVNPGEILMKSVIDIYDADKKVDLKAPIIKQDLELKKQVEELEKLAQETKKERKKRERLEKKNKN
ncbi:MAG: hypothetical protein HN921_17275 [Bacteroidetes bacterium]|jgi:hypothetical protein|nr:hypothetical protein [Bacteroidota bacterium]MBT5531386.1 hypothetical protein [Cytophagia bacterium]MBT4727997.1 hypothetical protein [Bacteroidota bacterium]MBT4968102.1 hypothetical protein [Bacteroidota bacterium]MBT5990073.1 hypothetical protein [Bacteroidota bacterium]